MTRIPLNKYRNRNIRILENGGVRKEFFFVRWFLFILEYVKDLH
jgi:hypothetical protein